jgi:hypothetical protein
MFAPISYANSNSLGAKGTKKIIYQNSMANF